MAEIKFNVKKFEKGENQLLGTESFYAEAVINDNVDTRELAEKIANKTGIQYYMVEAILVAVADQIFEECSESNRVTLAGQYGALLSVSPKVTGSIDPAWLAAQITSGKYQAGTALAANMLRADMVTASLTASIGITTNKKFRELAKAVKANTTESEGSAVTPENGGSTNPPAGGGSDDGDNS